MQDLSSKLAGNKHLLKAFEKEASHLIVLSAMISSTGLGSFSLS